MLDRRGFRTSWRIAVVASLAVGSTLAVPRASYAHSGTSSDPWNNPHVVWARTTVGGVVTGMYDDIIPQTSATQTFYAANNGLVNSVGAQTGGMYIGLQRGTTIHGVVTTSSATFSLFAYPYDIVEQTYRLLDSADCIWGADGDPVHAPGVSCSKAVTWNANTSYRVSWSATISANPSVCPVTSPTA